MKPTDPTLPLPADEDVPATGGSNGHSHPGALYAVEIDDGPYAGPDVQRVFRPLELGDEDGVGPEEAVQVAPTQQSFRLVVKASTERLSLLGVLARKMGLFVWGQNFLYNPRVARDMGRTAVVLVAIALFEFLAWTTAFNMLLHDSATAVSWLTGVAAFLGCLFAAPVFAFEHGYVTSDTTAKGWRTRKPVLLRLAVILVSAFITAVPVELFVFHSALQERFRVETTYAEALSAYQAYLDDMAAAAGPSLAQLNTEAQDSPQWRAFQTARETRIAADTAADTAQGLATSTEGEYSRARSNHRTRRATLDRLTAADAASDPTQRSAFEAASAAMGRASAWLGGSRRRRDDAAAAFTSALSAQTSATERERLAKVDWEAFSGAVIHNAEELRLIARERLAQRVAYLETVKRAEYGDVVVDPITGAAVSWKDGNPMARARVVWGLAHGEQPRWPESEADDRIAVASAFSLNWVEGEPDARTAMVREREADNYFRFMLSTFLLALIIPLMSLANKWVLSRETLNYLSTDQQAIAGNPKAADAMRVAALALEGQEEPRS